MDEHAGLFVLVTWCQASVVHLQICVLDTWLWTDYRTEMNKKAEWIRMKNQPWICFDMYDLNKAVRKDY